MAGLMVGCTPDHPKNRVEEEQIQKAFISCQTAFSRGQSASALACFAADANRYFSEVISAPAAHPPPSTQPQVDRLIRAAVNKSVPAEMRPTLTSEALLQRIMDRRFFNSADVGELSLGPVLVTGAQAKAQLLRRGQALSVSLSFVRENGEWKIDLMPLLPYAELYLRLNRALTGETEARQVNRLIAPLPPL